MSHNGFGYGLFQTFCTTIVSKRTLHAKAFYVCDAFVHLIVMDFFRVAGYVNNTYVVQFTEYLCCRLVFFSKFPSIALM
jgi:hypothetical protein